MAAGAGLTSTCGHPLGIRRIRCGLVWVYPCMLGTCVGVSWGCLDSLQGLGFAWTCLEFAFLDTKTSSFSLQAQRSMTRPATPIVQNRRSLVQNRRSLSKTGPKSAKIDPNLDPVDGETPSLTKDGLFEPKLATPRPNQTPRRPREGSPGVFEIIVFF